MPLTPIDVANKQFRITFRGYALEEVDAFLDEVEGELTRLLRDAAGRGSDAAAAPAPTAPSTPATAPPAAPTPGRGTSSTAAPGSATPSSAPVVPPTSRADDEEEALRGMAGQQAALRTLLLAQRTADEAIAEAQAEADQLRATARTETETAVGAAREQAETTLRTAREQAETALSAARTEADTTLTRARSEAARIDEEVAARITARTGDLDDRRRELEQRIEELHAFEREYRTRLQAYLQTQLRELQRAGSDDDGSGVSAGGRPGTAGDSGPRPQAASATAGPGGDADDTPGDDTAQSASSRRAAPGTQAPAVGQFTAGPPAARPPATQTGDGSPPVDR